MTKDSSIPLACLVASSRLNLRVLALLDAQVRTTNGGLRHAHDGISRVDDGWDGTIFKTNVVLTVVGHGFHGSHKLLLCRSKINNLCHCHNKILGRCKVKVL